MLPVINTLSSQREVWLVVNPQDACTESPAAWLSILRGLAAVATGVGAAVAGEECSEQEVAAAVPEGALQELLQAAEEQAQSAEAM